MDLSGKIVWLYELIVSVLTDFILLSIYWFQYSTNGLVAPSGAVDETSHGSEEEVEPMQDLDTAPEGMEQYQTMDSNELVSAVNGISIDCSWSSLHHRCIQLFITIPWFSEWLKW